MNQLSSPAELQALPSLGCELNAEHLSTFDLGVSMLRAKAFYRHLNLLTGVFKVIDILTRGVGI